MKLEEAQRLALELQSLLAPDCERLEIAGGIRRSKSEPHDIELVCIPLGGKLSLGSLGSTDLLEQRVLSLIHESVLERGDPDKAGKRAPSGPRSYRLKFKGRKVDIFSVLEPAEWYPVFVIRTGCADFSHWLVQESKTRGIAFKNGHLETLGGERLPEPKSEEEVFRLCGIGYIEPTGRDEGFMKRVNHVSNVVKPDAGSKGNH